MASFSTMQTGCITGGLKKSSGVNVLPDVAETWAKVRNGSNNEVRWMLAGYVKGSKRDITTLHTGSGDIREEVPLILTDDQPAFGGGQIDGRFVSFFYAGGESASSMLRGRASLHKNGVLNVLEGCDREINLEPMSDLVTEPAIPVTPATSPTKREEPPQTPSTPIPTTEKPPQGSLTFPYSSLQDPSKLPSPHVDPFKRESYLSEEEFHSVFGMDRASFDALPQWKRAKQKKELNLF